MSCPQPEPTGEPARTRRSPNRQARYAIAAIVLMGFGAACSARLPAPAGTFIEEFEGFPIYHGEPERPYEVLGHVYSAEAAARGVSPMKRESVAEARRRGADAIIVGVVFDGPGATRPGQPGTAEPTGTLGKWKLAVAIAWK